MPKNTPTPPGAGPNPSGPAGGNTVPCQPCKSISGKFVETEVKCGDPGAVEATGVLITEGADTSFAIVRMRDGAATKTVNGPMNGQRVRALAWQPQKPAGTLAADQFEFTVSADGVSAKSSNKFKFKPIPPAGPETKTFNCSSPPYGWTGKFDIKFADEQVTVTVKVKLINRLGGKPATDADPKPAAGDPVTDADKLAMKTEIEAKLTNKHQLFRKNCSFAAACTCAVPVNIVVNFVESGEHHVVDLYTGAGRANSGSWCRVKTRDNTYAHEVGHLLAWFDEYTGGAVGSPPRWLPNEPANIMNVGLGVPAEYYWDFRDWLKAKTGEDWDVR